MTDIKKIHKTKQICLVLCIFASNTNSMDANISLIKGIHPGIILDRELKKRKLQKGKFALSINEFPQTIATITKGKRRVNPALSLKIEKALGLEEGFLLVLQAYNDIEQEKKKQSANNHPDLAQFRPVLFWDTNIEQIDWDRNMTAVINRVFERGNEDEINEVIRFYGREMILAYLKDKANLDSIKAQNIDRYLRGVL